MRLIDADALKLDIVEEGQRSKRYKLGELWELNRDEIWKVIDAQLTIEKRKKGRWNTIQGDIVVCSMCGMGAPQVMTGCLLNRHLEPIRTNFCPNCGAMMEE